MPDNKTNEKSSPQELLGQIEAFTEEMLHSLTSINEKVKILSEKLDSDKTSTSTDTKTAPPSMGAQAQPGVSKTEPVKQSSEVEAVVPGSQKSGQEPEKKQPTATPTAAPASPSPGGGAQPASAQQQEGNSGQPGGNPQQSQPQSPTGQSAPKPPQGEQAGQPQTFQP
ncbi:hypothetical protein GF362_02030 [Candidatus Dojkabacteria bacterium]|nr:hypothetical protein [Candidatus Dojkabacteria bacterium]